MEVTVMISSSEIKQVLDNLPKNKPIAVEDIHAAVEKIVAPEDFNVPYTTTRPHNNYPKWKHKVQGVLSNYKRQNKLDHDPVAHTYTFY